MTNQCLVCGNTLPEEATPLTIEELRNMDGLPVWCADFECWGIVMVDKVGRHKNTPYLLGYRGCKFEYNIEQRRLRCYRMSFKEN